MKYWLLLFSTSILWASDPSESRFRESAAKAISILQRGQNNWYQKQSCPSCHNQVLPALAFQAAREHGIPFDEQAAHADAVQAFGYFSNLEQAVEYNHIIDPALDDGYLMIAAQSAGLRPSLVTAVYARLLAARQEQDGSWETIDVRPPQSYSRFTATAIALHALQIYAHPSQKDEVAQRVQRARNWLVSHQPRATEERVFQLLGTFWAGTGKGTLGKFATALQAAQQDDGGWNSREGRSSDAYSTGQALVALQSAGGMSVNDVAWRRGAEYLLRTQEPDGSWHVVSRLHPPAPVSPPYFESGHPYGHDQFISLMGESWAVMALAAALGPAKASHPVLPEVEPREIEPWAETLLFGSTADVKKLMDTGFDANSSTKTGGVTALMLAAPDVEKMKLLLDHGARAEALSKTKYSALLATAQYPGSTAAMNLLLDHGTKVRLPKGKGAPLFNAFPTFLAAFAGNTEIIPRLVREGDRLDDQMVVLGIFPAIPLLFIAPTHRTSSAGALIQAGAKVDQTDRDGLTSLAWAAIANRIEMARLLIEHGADVNHVDNNGMTPLLYAASIDFGDSSMIDLLLRADANPNMQSKEGLTALDLARKYKHTHLLSAFEQPRASR